MVIPRRGVEVGKVVAIYSNNTARGLIGHVVGLLPKGDPFVNIVNPTLISHVIDIITSDNCYISRTPRHRVFDSTNPQSAYSSGDPFVNIVNPTLISHVIDIITSDNCYISRSPRHRIFDSTNSQSADSSGDPFVNIVNPTLISHVIDIITSDNCSISRSPRHQFLTIKTLNRLTLQGIRSLTLY
ncbi:hypothetical protein J6590_023224 [Homalodisca vitripennis]|nr:hypothetical protein J6590_023224 [Homalodisca vitripennis]